MTAISRGIGDKNADLAKAKADVSSSKATFSDAKITGDLAEAVTDRRAISAEELLRRRNAMLIAKPDWKVRKLFWCNKPKPACRH